MLLINGVYPNGSTGRIVNGIKNVCDLNGVECLVSYAYDTTGRDDTLVVSSWLDNHIHNRIARITMLEGFFSRIHTLRWLRKVKQYNPDIIHLHNIHGNYINIPLLFNYIKKNDIKVVWTFHDCWPFTGYCKYFTICECEKWKSHCGQCPQHKKDPVNIFDLSAYVYSRKKEWFSGIRNMVIVTPSKWLAGLVRQSFLSAYPVRVINNGIDLSVFAPTISKFKNNKGIADKYMVLGVAFDWGERKGLDVFIELSQKLPVKYQIVLVGTNDVIDNKLPNNIISIHRTNNQKELAEIYSAADVFVNPTREENYPTVNREATSCGCPVITFDTGGSPELIDSTCGIVVPKDNVERLMEAIQYVCENKPFSIDACVKSAQGFDANDKYLEYIDLYKMINI